MAHTGRGVRPWARRRRGVSQRGGDSLSNAVLLTCKAGHRASQHLQGPGGQGVYHRLVKPGRTVNLDEPSEAPTVAGSLEPRCWQGRLPLRKRLFQLLGAAASSGILWLAATPLWAASVLTCPSPRGSVSSGGSCHKDTGRVGSGPPKWPHPNLVTSAKTPFH